MILTPHILTGALIGMKLENPILGSLFAFLSHYLLDAIPHWEYNFIKEPQKYNNNQNIALIISEIKAAKSGFIKIIADLIVGFGILLFLFLYFKKFSYLIFIYSLLGILADFLIFIYWCFPKITFLKKYLQIHQAIHFPKEKNIKIQKVGFLIEISIIILNIFYLSFYI